MRVLFLLLFLANGTLPICTPRQWFWYNLDKTLVEPIRNRLSYVLDIPAHFKEQPLGSVPRFTDCQSAGVHGGLDVLAVAIKYITTLSAPLWISPHYLYLFDECTVTTTRAEVALSKHKQLSSQCELATGIFLCAMLHWQLAIPWLIMWITMIILFWGGIFSGCVYLMSSQ